MLLCISHVNPLQTCGLSLQFNAGCVGLNPGLLWAGLHRVIRAAVATKRVVFNCVIYAPKIDVLYIQSTPSIKFKRSEEEEIVLADPKTCLKLGASIKKSLKLLSKLIIYSFSQIN